MDGRRSPTNGDRRREKQAGNGSPPRRSIPETHGDSSPRPAGGPPFSGQPHLGGSRAQDPAVARLAAGDLETVEAYLQPKVRLSDRAIVGAELLARWRHPEKGIVGPDQFLPLLLGHRHTRALLARMLDQAADALDRFGDTVPAGWTLSINADRRDLEAADFTDWFLRQLERRSLDPARLTIEITETSLVHQRRKLHAVLRRLRNSGLHISLDDYGTGYASLSDIQRLPLTELKVDRSFVSEVSRRQRHRIILQSTAELARALNLAVVAEGIEDRRTAEVCVELGCGYGQGYVFARPMPLAAFTDLLVTSGGRLQPNTD